MFTSTRLQFDRDVTRGFLRYANTLTDWEIVQTPWDVLSDGTRPQDEHCDAAVVRGGDIAQVRTLVRANGPLVTVTGMATPYPRVWVNDEAIGRTAADHLLMRCCRHVLFPRTPGIAAFEGRLKGFAQRFAGDKRTLETPTSSPGEGPATDVRRWIKRIAGTDKPVALVSASADGARRMMVACRNAGMRVPRDVAVLSCEYDELIAESCRPKLSGVQIHGDAVGYAAAELLSKLFDGSVDRIQSVVHLIAPGQVVERGSTEATPSSAEPAILNALDYIETNLGKSFGVADVAAHVGVCRRALETTFRRETGRTPLTVIRERRLHRAYVLVSSSAMAITDIAALCGYCHTAQLAAHFRQVYGVTPSAFRTRRSAATKM